MHLTLSVYYILIKDSVLLFILSALFEKVILIILPLKVSITNQDLQKVAEISGVLDAPDDFISANLRTLFSAFVPESEKIQCNEFVQKYLLLKQRYLDSIRG